MGEKVTSLSLGSRIPWLPTDVSVCMVAALVAFVVTWLTTPLARAFAFRLGAVDVPGGRHVHRRPTARLGGLALVGGVIVGCAALVGLVPDEDLDDPEKLGELMPVLVITAFVCALGAWDDCRNVSPRTKLVALTIAGLATCATGVQIAHADLPFLGHVEFGWFAIPITVVWVIACTNAINLIDGVDGAASGVAGISAGLLAVCALAGRDAASGLLLAATCGAALGFLRHNRQPARVFLGDSGSLALGFLLAAGSALGSAKQATAVSLGAALLVLAVPFLDTAQSFLRRFVRELRADGPDRVRRALRATTVGDRGHIHHRLLGRGLSHLQTSRVMVLVTLVTGVTAMLIRPAGALAAVTLPFAITASVYVLVRLAMLGGHGAPDAHDVVIPRTTPQAKTPRRTRSRELAGRAQRAKSAVADEVRAS